MNEPDDSKKTANAGETGPAGQNVEVKPGDYIREVRAHLRNGNNNDAYNLLLQATVRFPEDLLVLSYYGYLQTVVGKKIRVGVDTCKRAISLLEEKGSSGERTYYPVLYLNLGKAFIAANRKKDAFDALKEGLKYDSGNSDLKKELQGLGVRKQPVVPFLGRTNPINVLLGLFLKPSKKAPPAGKGAKRGR